MNPTQVAELLTGVLAEHDLELEAVEITAAGRRSRVRVVVDGDGPDGRGPGLDDIAAATRGISGALDGAPEVTGEAPYTLEVTSRGVSRPLTLPQHWRRNRGRLVKVDVSGSEPIIGRIAGTSDTEVTLDLDGTERTVPLADVAKAVVQVEFARKRRDTPGEDEPVLDTLDGQ